MFVVLVAYSSNLPHFSQETLRVVIGIGLWWDWICTASRIQFVLLLSESLVMFSLKEVCTWALAPNYTLDLGLDSQLHLKSGYGRKRLVYWCAASRKVYGNPLGPSWQLNYIVCIPSCTQPSASCRSCNISSYLQDKQIAGGRSLRNTLQLGWTWTTSK